MSSPEGRRRTHGAASSTIYCLELDVADIDHGNYGSFSLTLWRHPSEN